MAINNVNLADGTNTALLPGDGEVPAGKSYAVTTILVCNVAAASQSETDGGMTTFDMHIVKDGAAVSNTNKVINDLSMQASETFTFDTERIVLDAGDSIIVSSPSSPAGLLSMTISWIEV